MAQIAVAGDGHEGRGRAVGTAVWVASGIMHAAALAIMAALIIGRRDIEDPAIMLTCPPAIPQPEQKHPPAKPLPSEKPPVTLPEDAPEEARQSQLDLVVAPAGDDTDLPLETPATQGDLHAESDVALTVSTGNLFAIGAAGGDAGKQGDGPFRFRPRIGRPPVGTPPYAPRDVNHALGWFRRHQSPDGSWNAVGYWRNCTDEGPKCEPGREQAGNTDVALTGYAVLCFLGDGFDQTSPSTYRSNVRRGLDWLVANKQGDRDRAGIYGGSYGGFMTFVALFKQPGVFKAGAALRPVSDWSQYNHEYTANILNTPELDPEAYKRSSPLEYAEGLQDSLLIAHGMIDDNVLFQDSVRLFQRLIEMHKDNVELAPYPLERHSFIHADSWRDEYARILKLFESTLK